LCSADTLWIKDLADLLYKNYGKRGYKIPRILFPSIAIKILALFDKKIALVVQSLDWDFTLSNEKAKNILKWTPRSKEEATLAMAESLIEQGFV
jgi:dihydroflavonol-4-reductase